MVFYDYNPKKIQFFMVINLDYLNLSIETTVVFSRKNIN